MSEQKRRYLATAAHHDKMARIFDSVGRKVDADSARIAAQQCRENAAKIN